MFRIMNLEDSWIAENVFVILYSPAYKNSMPVKLIIQCDAKLSLINEEKAIFLLRTRMFLTDYAKFSF